MAFNIQGFLKKCITFSWVNWLRNGESIITVQYIWRTLYCLLGCKILLNFIPNPMKFHKGLHSSKQSAGGFFKKCNVIDYSISFFPFLLMSFFWSVVRKCERLKRKVLFPEKYSIYGNPEDWVEHY